MKGLKILILCMFVWNGILAQTNNGNKSLLDSLLATRPTDMSEILSNPNYLSFHSLPPFRDWVHDQATDKPLNMVTEMEPGLRIEVIGQIINKEGKPVRKALVYVYQTDDKGWYSDTAGHIQMTEGDRRHARLFGYLRTGSKGQFIFFTIRPVGYPNSKLPAHIHLEVKGVNGEQLITELLFEEDSRLTEESWRRASQEGFYKSKGKKLDGKLVYYYDLTVRD